MEVTNTVAQVRNQVQEWKSAGLKVGLVPTMGYLHEGHASLVAKAKATCDKVVVSVFVNPTQFGPTEDLAAYPRDFAHDCALLETCGADLVFHPEVSEMYAPGACTWIDMDSLTHGLCGKTRPIHFKGVCTVVGKLFNIVQPDTAFFGQKDAQQVAVIRRMVRDLNFNVRIVSCPIIRENDGLAKSSRNTYLSFAERHSALVLSRAVALGQKMAGEGETDALKIVGAMRNLIESEEGARIDYVEAVDALTIEPVQEVRPGVLFAMAVYIGKTRLIDNFITD